MARFRRLATVCRHAELRFMKGKDVATPTGGVILACAHYAMNILSVLP
jgi:hypothetical protein